MPEVLYFSYNCDYLQILKSINILRVSAHQLSILKKTVWYRKNSCLLEHATFRGKSNFAIFINSETRQSNHFACLYAYLNMPKVTT